MPGWSLNPFWEDEVEDSSRTAFDEPHTSSSQSSVQQPAPIPAPEPVPAPTPSTIKKAVDKKKSSPAEPAKKRATKKPKTAASHSKAPVLSCSDSEDDVIPATQPPVKRKRPAQEFQEEALFDKTQRPVRAATLRSFLIQRGASGFTTQRDPSKTGEFFIELRVYNSREAERLPANERWKNALTTLKVAADTNTPMWTALSKLVQAGKEEFTHIQPIMYPCAEY